MFAHRGPEDVTTGPDGAASPGRSARRTNSSSRVLASGGDSRMVHGPKGRRHRGTISVMIGDGGPTTGGNLVGLRRTDGLGQVGGSPLQERTGIQRGDRYVAD